ncbi:hypothetical protein KI387_034864, partial [Taxus chinensis]
LAFDLLEKWLKEHPESSICTPEGISSFKEIANYQDYHGLPAFREGIALFMEEVGGRKAKFEKERIVLTAGATAAHEVLTFCLADPGEAFLVPSPYYPGFDRDLRWRTGAEVIPVECKSWNNFKVTLSALEEAYREAENRKIRVKGVLITNPSNPLGTTMDSQTLRELVCFTREKKIHLICDEIYAGSVFSGPRFVSVAEIVAKEENVEHVHIIYSLSKDMGLPGFRVGVIYSYNDAVVTAARRMSSFSMVSSQTQHMLGGMLRDRTFVRKYIEENKSRLRERQREFVHGLRKAGIEVLAGSNAGLFCWVDLRHLLHPQKTAETELRLWNSIVKEIGLNVSPGLSCHCGESGWFRFCFANMTVATMQECLNRIYKHLGRNSQPIAEEAASRSPITFCTPRPKNKLFLSIDRGAQLTSRSFNCTEAQLTSRRLNMMNCMESPRTPIATM